MYSEQDLKAYARDYERQVNNLGQSQSITFNPILTLLFWLSTITCFIALL